MYEKIQGCELGNCCKESHAPEKKYCNIKNTINHLTTKQLLCIECFSNQKKRELYINWLIKQIMK